MDGTGRGTQVQWPVWLNASVGPFTAIPICQKHMVRKNLPKTNILRIKLINPTVLCFFNRNFETHLAQNYTNFIPDVRKSPNY
jgi:hypothetical protein